MRAKIPILALALLLAVTGLALSHSSLQRPRTVLSGGASSASSTGGDVSLRARLGQPIVGVVSSSGGEIALGQGFWHGGPLAGAHYIVHLPLIVSN